jgi:hypothetical protein
MHIKGPLDTFMLDQVERGASIVLTGNAGDGKTHALKVAAPQLRAAGAIVVEDATAEMRRGDPAPILAKWQDAVAQGRPFCIAINEYPLYQLRKAAPAFQPMVETWRRCRARLAYADGEGPAIGDLVVVDLSLRNPLAPDFFQQVLDAILFDDGFTAAIAQDRFGTASENAARLRDPRVRDRLREILARAVALGVRATVRQAWMLAARMVMGTGLGSDFTRGDWYFEALFAWLGGAGRAAALRRALDPAASSHPRWDTLLETGDPVLDRGWRGKRPPVPPQSRLDADVFAWLKRAFYFEHDDGLAAIELSEPEAAEFLALLNGQSGRQAVVEIVRSINAAYCPAPFTGREHHLYLWSGHRFHEQPSRSFVATQRVGVDDLRLETPRLPSALSEIFSFHPDHLMLLSTQRTGPRLRIDYPLFRTLKRLGHGLPRKLMPEREIHRLDAFLETLGACAGASGDTIWSVHLEHMQVLNIGLSADHRRYESVRADA